MTSHTFPVAYFFEFFHLVFEHGLMLARLLVLVRDVLVQTLHGLLLLGDHLLKRSIKWSVTSFCERNYILGIK